MGRRAKRTRRAISSQPVPNYVKPFERGVRVITELDRDADLGVEVEKRRQRLRDVTTPIDAIHLLGQMTLSESSIDADTYAESTHLGLRRNTSSWCRPPVAKLTRPGKKPRSPKTLR